MGPNYENRHIDNVYCKTSGQDVSLVLQRVNDKNEGIITKFGIKRCSGIESCKIGISRCPYLRDTLDKITTIRDGDNIYHELKQ